MCMVDHHSIPAHLPHILLIRKWSMPNYKSYYFCSLEEKTNIPELNLSASAQVKRGQLCEEGSNFYFSHETCPADMVDNDYRVHSRNYIGPPQPQAKANHHLT